MTKRLVVRLMAALGFSLLAVPAVYAADARGVEFTNCTEFVGVAPVAEARARALVPARYQLFADGLGARVIVRVADCEGVRVGLLPRRAGRLAQVGIIIASPDGTATDPNTSINNYTLTYATNMPALAARLQLANVPAVVDTNLAYEFAPVQGPSELYAAVTPEFGVSPTWFLHGSVTHPTFQTTFLANWWFDKGGEQTKMATTIPVIFFDFTSTVSFYTSRHNVIGQLIGGNRIANFPLSFRGKFAAGQMVVTEAP